MEHKKVKYIIIEAVDKAEFQHFVEVHVQLGYKIFGELSVTHEKNQNGCDVTRYRQPFIHENNGVCDKIVQLKIENDKAISS